MVRRMIVVGGHHTPALAVIEALKAKTAGSDLTVDFFWLGHKFSMQGDQNFSAEYQEVIAAGIPFFDLTSGRFYRSFSLGQGLRLLLGLVQSFLLLVRLRPNLILSFGGYLSVPVCLSAWLLRVPIFSHEQTTLAGLANRFNARLSRKVFISFESSRSFFPNDRVVFSGDPVRRSIFIDAGFFRFHNQRRTIYIAGGQQGAHRINIVLREVLPRLLEKFNVIHQSGRFSKYRDFEYFSEFKESLPLAVRNLYVVKGFFNSAEIGSVFARADLVVSRAGANTVYELGLLGKVALLIPISWSSQSEQVSNARYLAQGGSSVLEEADFSPTSLIVRLSDLLNNFPVLKKRAEEFRKDFPPRADLIIANHLIDYFHTADNLPEKLPTRVSG